MEATPETAGRELRESLRVLVVSQYFWPESFRINEIVEYLTGRGHDVTVLTGRPNYPEGIVPAHYREHPEQYTDFHGAKVVRVPHLLRRKNAVGLFLNYATFALSGMIAGTLRLAGRRFDVILVCQQSPVTVAFPGIVQRWIKRAPLAMWILDLWPESISAVGAVRSGMLFELIGAMVSFIYRRCDKLLIQSRSFASSLLQRGAAPETIDYLPAWAEGVFEKPPETISPARELASDGQLFKILFAGNLGEAQDLKVVLRAAVALREKNVRWFIVGDGRAAQALRSEIAELGLEASVVMIGRRPVESMPAFFAAADALLVSLKDEPAFAMTIPGKVQNYMRSGRPIIAMLGGEGAAVVAQSGGGLVTPPGDAAALARTVECMMEMTSDERARMAKRGLEFSIREFDRATLFARLETWLREIAKEGPRDGRTAKR